MPVAIFSVSQPADDWCVQIAPGRRTVTLAPLAGTAKSSNLAMPRQTHRPTHITTRPTPPAPDLMCPRCHRPLRYQNTAIGGVPGHLERWDTYSCLTCGTFEYRHRTGDLKSIAV